MISQDIEGYRTKKFKFGHSNARDVKCTFWCYSSKTGTFSVSLRNGNRDRSYIREVTINAALTWECKTVTFPGLTSGTWAVDVNAGMRLGFCFGTGSTFQGAADSWNSANDIGTSGQTTWLAANDYAYIAAPFLYDAELSMSHDQDVYSDAFKEPMLNILECERYFFNMHQGASGGTVSATQLVLQPQVHVPMRTAPTVTTTAAIKVDISWVANYTQSSGHATLSFSDQDNGGIHVALQNFSSMVVGYPCVQRNDGGQIHLDARMS
jgi:hypothetical protein